MFEPASVRRSPSVLGEADSVPGSGAIGTSDAMKARRPAADRDARPTNGAGAADPGG